MKMQCGMNIVTINPYVWNKRRKSYADVCKVWDEKINKFATEIDCTY